MSLRPTIICDALLRHFLLYGVMVAVVLLCLGQSASAQTTSTTSGTTPPTTTTTTAAPPMGDLNDLMGTLGAITTFSGDPAAVTKAADTVVGLFGKFNVDNALKQAGGLGSQTAEGVLNGLPNATAGVVQTLTQDMANGKLNDLLRGAYGQMEAKYKTMPDGAEKTALYGNLLNMNKVITQLPVLQTAVGDVKGKITDVLAKAGLGDLVGGVGDLLKGQQTGQLGDIVGIAGKVTNANLDGINGWLEKLGNPSVTELGSFLPEGIKPEVLTKVFDSLKTGSVAGLLDGLKDKLGGLLSKLKDGPELEKLKSLMGKLDVLKGKIAGKVGEKLAGLLAKANAKIPGLSNLGPLLKDAGPIGAALGALAKTGDLSQLPTLLNKIPGLDKIVPGLGALGGLLGAAKNLTCTQRYDSKAKLDTAHQGNGRTIDGTAEHDEIPDAPVVDCNKDNALMQRVEGYFNYKPPANNREVLGQQIAAAKKAASAQDATGCDVNDVNTRVSEPCQDNRWRDACLAGTAQQDLDFASYGRPLEETDPVHPGVRGSLPLMNTKDLTKANCMVPKNTEVTSTLMLDAGWRYRHACPGDTLLTLSPQDELDQKLSPLTGSKKTSCEAPIPKCELKVDWSIKSDEWANKAYGTVASLFREGKNDDVRTLANVFAIAGDNLEQQLRNKLKPDSAEIECKPAYWGRLIMDSCANEYVAQAAADPDFVFNPTGADTGFSPAFCQPFVTNTTLNFDEEYSPTKYILAAAKGLLQQEHMPWIDYYVDESGPWKGANAQQYYEAWKKSQPDRKIKALPSFANNLLNQKFKDPHTLMEYASQPVERILDPSHPFSPRYDVAMFTNGTKITDRTVLKDGANTKMIPSPIALGKCMQEHKVGYFEYGDNVVYCAATPVEILRPRYEQFRVCVGCQMEANQHAFWAEVEFNALNYRLSNCLAPKTHSSTENKKSSDTYCNYGEKICGACSPIEMAKIALKAVACSAGDAVACAEAVEETVQCVQCNGYADYEALDRARKRINHTQKPEYGPTKTKEDGKNWPICSTRYDFPGEPDLCVQAKQDSGNCAKTSEAAVNDPNIGKAVPDTGLACASMDYDEICHAVAKPLAGLNVLKIRTRKEGFTTEDSDWNFGRNIPSALKDRDPPAEYAFRTYFGNNRPYMRYWDTGKEAMQQDEISPDYSCDIGANDTIIGVGRDYNSIHGRKLQTCSYNGGGGVGGDCFEMTKWKQTYPSLAGSEWAELKMYQMNCLKVGLNCLCQNEKLFADKGSEAMVLASLAATHASENAVESNNTVVPVKAAGSWSEHWRGYAGAPLNYETAQTSPAITPNQQFPYLYDAEGLEGKKVIQGGLDQAMKNDVIILPAGSGTLPRLAVVVEANTPAAYDGDKAQFAKAQDPNGTGYRGYITIRESNNGKFPDACGNTTYLDRGLERTIYARVEDIPEEIRTLMQDQITATYYCDDPYMKNCVERRWDSLKLYRYSLAP